MAHDNVRADRRHFRNLDRVNAALNVAGRGLPRRFSLAQLLDEQRGKRNRMRLPRLKESKILAWAWR